MAKYTINSTTENEAAPTVILNSKQQQKLHNYSICKKYARKNGNDSNGHL